MRLLQFLRSAVEVALLLAAAVSALFFAIAERTTSPGLALGYGALALVAYAWLWVKLARKAMTLTFTAWASPVLWLAHYAYWIAPVLAIFPLAGRVAKHGWGEALIVSTIAGVVIASLAPRLLGIRGQPLSEEDEEMLQQQLQQQQWWREQEERSRADDDWQRTTYQQQDQFR